MGSQESDMTWGLNNNTNIWFSTLILMLTQNKDDFFFLGFYLKNTVSGFLKGIGRTSLVI